MKIPYRGGAVTLLLVVLLLTPPAELLEQKGAYADVRADLKTDAARPIYVQDGLTDDPAATIPRELGDWVGTDDDSWPEELEDVLDYDSLLVRHYSQPGFYVPIQLMVITAREAQAFHNPQVCFRYQDGIVSPLDDSRIDVAGTDVTIGRMFVEFDQESRQEPAKLVHNLYVVQEKFAAPERTTWVRLIFTGTSQENADQLLPYMDDLMSRIAPYVFTGRDQQPTTFSALETWGGWPLAGGAIAIAAIPLLAESIVLWRRRDA